MKKLTAIAALSVIVMGSAFAQNSLEDQANFYQTGNSDVYRLVVDAPEKGKTAINVFNERGKKVFSDVAGSSSAFARAYNFSQLPAGLYRVEVERGGQMMERTLSHFNSPGIYQPFYADLNQSSEEGKVDLQVVGADSRVVEVVIKDINGKTLYIDEVSGVMGFKRTYDLAKVGKNVAFEVKVEDKIINMRL